MKRTLIIIVAVVAMLAGGTTAKAQTQNTPEDIMSKFFAMFNNDVNQAIDYLFSTNEWLERHYSNEGKVRGFAQTVRKFQWI